MMQIFPPRSKIKNKIKIGAAGKNDAGADDKPGYFF